MSLAALACSPKDTGAVRITQATETPPAVGTIRGETAKIPTVVFVPGAPGGRDAKGDTAGATATGTPDAGKTAEPTGTARPTQGSDTPPLTPTEAPTPVPTRAPEAARTATPGPTATRTPEAKPTKTPQELDAIYRQQLEAQINQYFFEVNRRNLGVDPVLSSYAQTCAGFMAIAIGNGAQFGHMCKDQPQIAGIINSGWKGGRVNENIAWAG